jgi:hypothetical protein
MGVARPTQAAITIEELRQAGFSPEQIERLQALRTAYPVLEYLDSRGQLNRLIFLRWCYATGRTSEWTPAGPPSIPSRPRRWLRR